MIPDQSVGAASGDDGPSSTYPIVGGDTDLPSMKIRLLHFLVG